MIKKSIALVLGLSLMGLAGCEIQTPEIHGVVLDAETKQPVEGAWVHFTIEVHTKTIAGGTTAYLRVEPPHTRTNERGEFIIPAKQFETPSFPHGFGTEVGRFGLIADTIDDRQGGIGVNMRDYFIKNQKDFGMGGSDLMNWWGKDKVKVTLWIKPREALEDYEEYSAYLQGLYRYCSEGRVFVERPPVQGGCDEWERNYVITKNENFLSIFKEPKTKNESYYYSIIMHRLGYLYKWKGDYQKALEIFIKARDFDKKRKMDLWLEEYEIQIKELQELIRKHKR